jgi:hypothetical protein
LGIYCNNKKKLRTIERGDKALGVLQNYRIIHLIERLILIEDQSLNDIIRDYIIEGNGILKISLKKNDEELVRLMEIMGETEKALDQTEDFERELDLPVVRATYPKNPSSSKAQPKQIRLNSINNEVFNNSHSVIPNSENIKVCL